MVRESPDPGAANTAPHGGDCGGCRRDRLAAARGGCDGTRGPKSRRHEWHSGRRRTAPARTIGSSQRGRTPAGRSCRPTPEPIRATGRRAKQPRRRRDRWSASGLDSRSLVAPNPSQRRVAPMLRSHPPRLTCSWPRSGATQMWPLVLLCLARSSACTWWVGCRSLVGRRLAPSSARAVRRVAGCQRRRCSE